MEITIQRNIIVDSKQTTPFLADAFHPKSGSQFPLVIFVHGYKGYKDWGAWDLVAETFAKNGFYFVKFNFSHNGTTIDQPKHFEDLEGFANNNYTKELFDLDSIINHFITQNQINTSSVTLIGHSRGGGISIIKASEDIRINNLILWASVDTLDRFPKNEAFEEWKNNGVYTTLNGRTKQNMPHYFQFFEDYEKNENRLNVEKALQKYKGHILIAHGTHDEAVSHQAAINLAEWNNRAELFLVDQGGHTFGAREPWENQKLPKDLESVVLKSIEFITTRI